MYKYSLTTNADFDSLNLRGKHIFIRFWNVIILPNSRYEFRRESNWIYFIAIFIFNLANIFTVKNILGQKIDVELL